MGGSAVADDWEVTTNEKRTLVLLGRTSNGKSATGNSILGSILIRVFLTSGLFDFTGEPDVIGKEIVKCMELAMDGIHAALLVLSVRTRFSREELAAIQSFQEFFGQKIRDYMIVVFTGGDETLDEYLGKECPEPLNVRNHFVGYICTLSFCFTLCLCYV
ncbi:hypothetical protein KY284_027508 [Solanum tuberosum]|nr:hypothetical protein KY284_027508 [Solanum tuberosum]